MNNLYSDEYLSEINRRIDELANNKNIEENKFVPMEIRNFVKEIKRLYHREKELKYFNDILESQNLDKAKEIERLHSIIKEALILTEHTRFEEQYASDEILLPILNKLRESGIRNYIKVEGSDKE